MRRINPRSKPRLKCHREMTDLNPPSAALPPLPPPSKEEMKTITAGGKEYHTLVKTYPHIEVAPDPNFVKMQAKGFLEVVDH